MFDERPPRADRGAVRYLVLDAISDTPRHGYEIMAAIEVKSHETYRPSPGVVYPTLQLLEELGHVRVTEKDDKKVYAITAAGAKDLEEHREEVSSFYDHAEDVSDDHQADELYELSQIVRRLLRTFRRAARRGRLTASTMAKVRSLLEDTARQLEGLVEKR
jgi:DNA-binding PadR family transcriptional regulator